MRDPWQVLIEAGLPLMGPARRHAPAASEMADAVRELVARGGKTERERQALAAFVLAWLHHWPTSFRASFGSDADGTIGWARAQCGDLDRIRKLRRIAIERLATVL